MISMKTDVESEILRRFKNHCEKSTLSNTEDSKTIQNHCEKCQITVSFL